LLQIDTPPTTTMKVAKTAITRATTGKASAGMVSAPNVQELQNRTETLGALIEIKPQNRL
jgi:xanthine dehydrogenase molybdopterin-binding subunit B